MSEAAHISVMLNEVLEYLQPRDGEVYVDGTLGAGGYTRAILDAANCTVIAIDRDQLAHDMAQTWKDKYGSRLILVKGAFSDLEEHLKNLNIEKVDAIVLDLGVSSMQLDQRERGFSFRFDGPLDMRMDRTQGLTAADLVNTLGEEDLANVIYIYGEERMSRHIASAIVKTRVEQKIETTAQLADIVRKVVRFSPKDKIDPATRTFQALRLKVNDELGEVERVLASAENVLAAQGRLIVVTFHSLEDRIVKNFMLDRSKQNSSPSRYHPATEAQKNLTFSLLSKKAVLPTESETRQNPRSRSAKLRAAIKRAAESEAA